MVPNHVRIWPNRETSSEMELSTLVLLNCFHQQFLYFFFTYLLVSAINKGINTKNESNMQNYGLWLLLSSCSFLQELTLCKSRNFDLDCDTYGLHIMLSSFYHLHGAAVEEMLQLSFTPWHCYCKNLRSWEMCDFC